MRKILNFEGFLNESLFGTYMAFIFVPVDKNFVSVSSNIAQDDLKPPSQGLHPNSYGYVLVPVNAETANMLERLNTLGKSDVADGEVQYVKSADQDGFIVINYNPTSTTYRHTGISPKSAEIPGMMQNLAIYLSNGPAYLIDKTMRKSGWEENTISALYTKIANGFPKNTILEYQGFGGKEEALKDLTKILAISSFNCGLFLNDLDLLDEYGVTEELLSVFENSPADFIRMNLSPVTIEKVKQLAADKNPTQNITNTIDNLSDLKSSGLFDD